MLDPKLNVKLHEEIYGAITKIIFDRYPRIKGAYCASIAYGIIDFISEREASAPSQPQQEAVPAEPSEQDKLDAARYRWLRNTARSVDWSRNWNECAFTTHCRIGVAEMDKAIDAAIAMSAAKEPGHGN